MPAEKQSESFIGDHFSLTHSFINPHVGVTQQFTVAFPDLAPLQADRQTDIATARRPLRRKTDKGDEQTGCPTVNNYLRVCV